MMSEMRYGEGPHRQGPIRLRGDRVVGGLWIGAMVRTQHHMGVVIGDRPLTVAYPMERDPEGTIARTHQPDEVWLDLEDFMRLNIEGLSVRICHMWRRDDWDRGSKLLSRDVRRRAAPWSNCIKSGEGIGIVEMLCQVSIYLSRIDHLSNLINFSADIPRWTRSDAGIWSLFVPSMCANWHPLGVPGLGEAGNDWRAALEIVIAHEEAALRSKL